MMPIENIAIIGAGPGGLATLYEFLHTNEDGSSTVGKARAKKSQFQVTVFEQKDKAGGVWAPLSQPDLKIPPQSIMNTELYNRPEVIQPSRHIPKQAIVATLDKPWVQKTTHEKQELEWQQSGVYPDLYTNIPSRWTRFSYLPNEKEYLNKERPIYPFLTGDELCGRFQKFITDENLQDYIRFNTRVENISKNNEGKWVVTLKHRLYDSLQEEWYSETFDAIIIANGHYSVPYIPQIKGLANYSRCHPGQVLHAKAYRDAIFFKDKKVLVVGGSISTANLVQYIYPLAKKMFISRRGKHHVFEWINDGLSSEGIETKPTIKEFKVNDVIFEDGTIESDFDVILLTTGYHYHYPSLKTHLEVTDPSNLSRVKGLYYHTFNIEDPTLAITGVAISGINFHTIEASAAAIAGVFSGYRKLPSKEEQRKWEQERVKSHGDNVRFHYYSPDSVKSEFIDPLHEFSPKDRYNPIEADWPYLEEIALGVDALEKLFYRIKNDEQLVSKN